MGLFGPAWTFFGTDVPPRVFTGLLGLAGPNLDCFVLLLRPLDYPLQGGGGCSLPHGHGTAGPDSRCRLPSSCRLRGGSLRETMLAAL
jgi:hypothetical protein